MGGGQFCISRRPSHRVAAEQKYGVNRERCEYGFMSRSEIHLVLSPDGDVYPCHRMQDGNINHLGNIADMSIEDVLRNEKTYVLSTKGDSLPPDCKTCDHLSLCNAGCMATHDDSGRTIWCEGLVQFFDYMKSQDSMSAEEGTIECPDTA